MTENCKNLVSVLHLMLGPTWAKFGRSNSSTRIYVSLPTVAYDDVTPHIHFGLQSNFNFNYSHFHLSVYVHCTYSGIREIGNIKITKNNIYYSLWNVTCPFYEHDSRIIPMVNRLPLSSFVVTCATLLNLVKSCLRFPFFGLDIILPSGYLKIYFKTSPRNYFYMFIAKICQNSSEWV